MMKLPIDAVTVLFQPCSADGAGGDIRRTVKELVENGIPYCPACGDELHMSEVVEVQIAEGGKSED